MKSPEWRNNTIERKGESDLFLDREVFESDYLPEKIHPRRTFRKVAGFLRRCIDGRSESHLLLVGSNGAGKTLVARYYGRLAYGYARRKGVRFRVLYLNCREISSSYGFWGALLSKLLHAPPRGLALSDLVETFFEKVRDKDRVVVMLDETDHLEQGSIQNVLSPLLRSRKGDRPSLSLILISNREISFPPSVPLDVVPFEKYTKEELLRILHERARLGLKSNSVEKASLEQISSYTEKFFRGDVRTGIRLLYHSALHAGGRGSRKIEEQDVLSSLKGTQEEAYESVIEALTEDQLTVLRSLLRCGERHPTSRIYKTCYVPLCAEKQNKTLSYGRFLKTVQLFSCLRLVEIYVRKRGTGYSRFVELKVDRSTVDRILRSRMG